MYVLKYVLSVEYNVSFQPNWATSEARVRPREETSKERALVIPFCWELPKPSVLPPQIHEPGHADEKEPAEIELILGT